MYQVEVIRDLDKFRNLKPEWELLLSQSYTDTIFLTWEWTYAWWKTFGEGCNLFLITVRNQGDELIGLAPLFIRRTKRYYFPVREISLIGDGLADRQDFILTKLDPQIFNEIFSKIYEYKKEWDLIYLDQIPPDGVLIYYDIYKNFIKKIERSSICPFLKIDREWENYYGLFDKKFQQETKRCLNRLQDYHNHEINTRILDEENYDDLIDLMETVENKSHKIIHGKSFFSSKKNVSFLAEFLKMIYKKYSVVISNIKVNQDTIAFAFGFIYRKKMFGYLTAFDKSYSKLSPGKLVIYEKLRWFFKNPDYINIFDFSRGDSELKNKWTVNNIQHYRVIIFHRSFYSIFLKMLITNIRPFVKRMIRWS